MFGKIFGEYLAKQQLISAQQLKEVLERQSSSRAKIGLIAVAEKMLTEEEAEKINRVQAREDRRFGDIAVEKKLLTGQQVETLLSLQGNPYHTFMQAVTECSIMTEEALVHALTEFQKETGYSAEALEALKSGNIDRILPLFLHMDNPIATELAGVAVRTIMRLIDRGAVPGHSAETKQFPFACFAMQNAVGDHSLLLGLAGEEKGMRSVAGAFANEKFEQMDEDAFDSVCEFVNCINGLNASALSVKDIRVDMVPPSFYRSGSIKGDDAFCVIPVRFSEDEINIIISIDRDITIETM